MHFLKKKCISLQQVLKTPERDRMTFGVEFSGIFVSPRDRYPCLPSMASGDGTISHWVIQTRSDGHFVQVTYYEGQVFRLGARRGNLSLFHNTGDSFGETQRPSGESDTWGWEHLEVLPACWAGMTRLEPSQHGRAFSQTQPDSQEAVCPEWTFLESQVAATWPCWTSS